MLPPISNYSGVGAKKYRTLVPLQSHSEGKRSDLSSYAQATLGTGDMSAAVRLPKGEDLNEWLAVNSTYTFATSSGPSQQARRSVARAYPFNVTLARDEHRYLRQFTCLIIHITSLAVDFFNEINLLYGTISDSCTPQSCPKMVAGAGYQYHWMDGEKYKEPVEVSAPEYVELLMNWVDNQLTNEQIFPLQLGSSFPKDFHQRVQKIFQRLFRVYAHVYHSHFDRVLELHAEAHLNTCFKHFIYFAREFKLLDESHTKPLQGHIDSLLQGRAQGSGDECKDTTGR